MAKLRLPHGKNLQSVVEWRFERAHRYWDDCGKLIAAVETRFPGLKCQGLEKDGFKFAGKSAGLTAASFYWDKATITQLGIGDAQLSSAAAIFWSILHEGLALEAPKFIGHRTWIIYTLTSAKDGAHWLEQIPLWEFVSPDMTRLGRPRTPGSVLRTTIDDTGRRLRLEPHAGTIQFERDNQREAHHGIIVDADIIIEAPSELPRNVALYLEENLRFIRESIEPLIRTR